MNARQIPRSVAVAGFCCLAACLFLVQELLFPPAMPDWQSLAAQNETAKPGAAMMIAAPPPDARLYELIAARPVFAESRRPAPGTGGLPGSKAASGPINFSLMGVIGAPGQRLAIIREAGAASAAVVHVGSVLNGWKILKIDAASITVRSETTTESVKLTR